MASSSGAAEAEMTSKRETWRSCEGVAVYLLDQIASTLDLERVEDKQKIRSRSSNRWPPWPTASSTPELTGRSS
jgi:hypothetical protein